MNLKIISLICFFSLICTVFVCGCTDSSDEIPEMADLSIDLYFLNPLNKNISNFDYSYNNVPFPQNFEDYRNFQQINSSRVGYTEEELLNKSDLICYATVKEVLPSYWTTPDGSKPTDLSDPEYTMFTNINFEIENTVKGTSGDNISVIMYGGEVNRFVVFHSGRPDPWSFKEGDEYLLCLAETETPGLYRILDIFQVNG